MHCWTYGLLTRVTVSERTSSVGKKPEFSHLQDVYETLHLRYKYDVVYIMNIISPCILPMVIGRVMARGKDF